jgi:hypothetical protein
MEIVEGRKICELVGYRQQHISSRGADGKRPVTISKDLTQLIETDKSFLENRYAPLNSK